MRNLIIVTIILFYFAAGANDEDFEEAVKKIKEEVKVGDIIVVQTGGEWANKPNNFEVLQKTESDLVLYPIQWRQTATSAIRFSMVEEGKISFEKLHQKFQTKKYKKFDIDESIPTLEEIKDQLNLNKNGKHGYEVEVCIDDGEYFSAVIKDVDDDEGIKFSAGDKSRLWRKNYTWQYMVIVYKMRKKGAVKEKSEDEKKAVAEKLEKEAATEKKKSKDEHKAKAAEKEKSEDEKKAAAEKFEKEAAEKKNAAAEKKKSEDEKKAKAAEKKKSEDEKKVAAEKLEKEAAEKKKPADEEKKDKNDISSSYCMIIKVIAYCMIIKVIGFIIIVGGVAFYLSYDFNEENAQQQHYLYKYDEETPADMEEPNTEESTVYSV